VIAGSPARRLVVQAASLLEVSLSAQGLERGDRDAIALALDALWDRLLNRKEPVKPTGERGR
jgi:hypothetical protein